MDIENLRLKTAAAIGLNKLESSEGWNQALMTHADHEKMTGESVEQSLARLIKTHDEDALNLLRMYEISKFQEINPSD